MSHQQKYRKKQDGEHNSSYGGSSWGSQMGVGYASPVKRITHNHLPFQKMSGRTTA
jgi:hypothetical protein